MTHTELVNLRNDYTAGRATEGDLEAGVGDYLTHTLAKEIRSKSKQLFRDYERQILAQVPGGLYSLNPSERAAVEADVKAIGSLPAFETLDAISAAASPEGLGNYESVEEWADAQIAAGNTLAALTATF